VVVGVCMAQRLSGDWWAILAINTLAHWMASTFVSLFFSDQLLSSKYSAQICSSDIQILAITTSAGVKHNHRLVSDQNVFEDNKPAIQF